MKHLLGLLLLLCSCGPEASPGAVFDALWADFDARYALFEARAVDWDAARARWEPRLVGVDSDDALFEVLFGLLRETGDDHVYLARFDDAGHPTRVVTAGRLGGQRRDDFSLPLVEQRLEGAAVGGGGRLRWGRLSPRVGWLHVTSLDGATGGTAPDAWTAELSRALEALDGTSALVLDLRNNGGGRAANALAIASALVERPAPVFTVRTRNGPARDAFDAPTRWDVVPRDGHAPPRALVLLTNRFTMSAAETLVAAVLTRGDVVHVGETTTGALSAKSHERQLPNGWSYTISVQDFRLPDGTSPEGVGFIPAIAVDNTTDDLSAGRDPMLERALAEAEARAR